MDNERRLIFAAAFECCNSKELSEDSVAFLDRSQKLGKFHYSPVMINGSPRFEEVKYGSALNTFICRAAESFMQMFSICPRGCIR